MSDTHSGEHGEHGHGDHAHLPFLAHHFDTPQQQFDSGKLGIWLFLVTEVLFFSGLFCFYIVFRFKHPEIFVYASKFLNVNLGALNTIVLLFSSLTAAWAVRCAQLNQRTGLIVNLVITLVCAFVFLGVKTIEYKTKFEEGIFWGAEFEFNPAEHPHATSGGHGGSGHEDEHAHGDEHGHEEHAEVPRMPRFTPTFFSIYFALTGLHAFHVICGIGAIGWVLFRSIRGDFNSQYFGPVDYVALYWHLVDLIWIYLFPLLYLINA